MFSIHILIVDVMHPSLFAMLEEMGWQYTYAPEIKPEEVIQKISNYQGLIIRSKINIDKNLLAHATSLLFIARAGAGLDQIDLEEVKNRNIALFNAPEGNKYAVAEHALAMLLSLFNHLRKADNEVRQKIWNREGNRGTELFSKTVGIIGYGNMGSAFAKCLSGFGCKVLAYDKYHKALRDDFATPVSMQQIFEQTDILSLHIPLSTETSQLVDYQYLSQFRKPIYLINTARGEIVNLADLATAIENKLVLGACLDVLENEKLHTLNYTQNITFEKLKNLENIIFSPHVAGWTHESYIRINQVLIDKITQFIQANRENKL
jgi:D-3-phosphoglycerate dehydrogenase